MYGKLASVYDKLMGDVPYDRFVQVFEQMLDRTGLKTDRLIDMGCGTGILLPQFLRRARMVIGVDPSADMLAQAAQRVGGFNRRVSFVQARAHEFRSPVQADGCVAFCDVLSYTRGEQELIESLRRMAAALATGGWVLFDLHSPYKVLHVIGENLYGDIRPEEIAIMKTEIAPLQLQVTYDLLLLLQEADGRFARYEEQHIQRAYLLPTVLRALACAGFSKVVLGADFQLWWESDPELVSAGSGASEHVHQLARESGICIEGTPDLAAMEDAQRWFFFAQLPTGDVNCS